jgi:serine protease AprX
VTQAFLLPFLLVAVPAATAGDHPKVSPEATKQIGAVGPDDMLPVIIQTVSDPSSGHFARLHGRGGVLKGRHVAIRGYSARVPAAQIELLADDPEVERISYDTPVQAHLDVATRAIRADLARVEHAGLTGKGVGIAMIDTGVMTHADFQRPKGQAQVLEVEVVGREPGLMDYYGHGTHVAGILVGSGAASSDKLSFRTFRGMAPEAQLISIRALQPDGSGNTSDVIAAIDWAIRFKGTYNIRVVNLSLGHPVYESYTVDPLCRAVRAASDAGLLVVVAAGNDGGVGSGFGTISSPGNEPTAVTVGAMDDSNSAAIEDDLLAWYSSKGPTLIDHLVKPDLVAPGTWIVSTRAPESYLDTQYHDLALQFGDYKTDPANALRDGDYYTLAGTSMAAPFVAGTAALMIQREPLISPATVKARLMRSAVKDENLVFETGAGYLDVVAALADRGQSGASPSPRSMLAADGFIYIENTGLIWQAIGSEALIWSTGEIWGDGKGARASCLLTDVPPEILSAYGAVWGSGGKVGAKSTTLTSVPVENDQVTGSGLIWSVCGATYSSMGVDSLAAIWGGKK